MLKKIIITIFISLFITNITESNIFKYKVISFGIHFADSTFKENITKNNIYLTTTVKSKKIASLIKKVNNEYKTVIEKSSLTPLFQEKQINDNYYYNIFMQDKNKVLSKNQTVEYKKGYISNLFSIFYYIKSKKPMKPKTFLSISCNTLWEVKVTFMGERKIKLNNKMKNTMKYRLNFKALEPIEKMKKRYNDLFLKEAYWNSSVIKLFIDKKDNILYKAILESFNPNIILQLKET